MQEQQPAAVPAPWLSGAVTPPATAESSATAAPTGDGGTTPADPVVTPATAPEGFVAKVEAEAEKVEAEVVEFVTVTVPRAFKLRTGVHVEREFKAGVQEMERELAEHWYSVANGVTIYEK